MISQAAMLPPGRTRAQARRPAHPVRGDTGPVAAEAATRTTTSPGFTPPVPRENVENGDCPQFPPISCYWFMIGMLKQQISKPCS